MAESFTAHIEDNRVQELAKLQSNLDRELSQISTKKAEYIALKEADATYNEVRTALAEAQEKGSDYNIKLDRILSARKDIQKERSFYTDHDVCPTCEQSIDETFKGTRISTLEKKDAIAQKAEHQCRTAKAQYVDAQTAARTELEESTAIRKDMAAIESILPIHMRYAAQIRADMDRIQNAPVVVPQKVDIADLDARLERLDAEHAQLSEQRVVIEAASMLLKDNGIKARVVKHYLPIINRTINHYLNAMDFPILFTLDEEFNEIIKSRHRDDFSYESFSDGEKKRIDLALLLTWRHVARMKNSAATNLLILDEVFDSSLDAAGTEEFLKIIADLEKDTSVFVISHKTDQLVDKFANTIVFEKMKGFSTIK